MLMHSIAATLMQQIQASPIGSVTGLIEVLLSSKNLALQTSIALMKTKDRMQHILDALLAHACRETIIDWAIEQACGRFRSEILHISRVESGLHFNMSQACAADILNLTWKRSPRCLRSLHHIPGTWFKGFLIPTL